MFRLYFYKKAIILSRFQADVEEKKKCTSNRYLLVMTEKYSALPIIEGMSLEEKNNMSVIFGSSFPKDQEFTQVLFYESF